MRTNKRVTAIVIKDDKILLVHRRKMGKEYWVVVGGGAEEGETMDQALEREVMEETGLKPVGYKFLGESKGEYDDDIVFYSCELEDGELILGGPENERNTEDNWYHVEWFPIKNLNKISLYPASARNFLKKKSE